MLHKTNKNRSTRGFGDSRIPKQKGIKNPFRISSEPHDLAHDAEVII